MTASLCRWPEPTATHKEQQHATRRAATVASMTVAIVQARTGSTRLPGKVLLDLAGRCMLARVIERTRRSRMLEKYRDLLKQ